MARRRGFHLLAAVLAAMLAVTLAGGIGTPARAASGEPGREETPPPAPAGGDSSAAPAPTSARAGATNPAPPPLTPDEQRAQERRLMAIAAGAVWSLFTAYALYLFARMRGLERRLGVVATEADRSAGLGAGAGAGDPAAPGGR
ncbi:MAG: hypothetical protein HY719_16740 [Planctomycetes bacterium]|nr:hypothetical protein [Planctomycetota bacterium]